MAKAFNTLMILLIAAFAAAPSHSLEWQRLEKGYGPVAGAIPTIEHLFVDKSDNDMYYLDEGLELVSILDNSTGINQFYGIYESVDLQMFAVGDAKRVYKSTDDGSTWNVSSNGFQNNGQKDVFLSGNKRGELFALVGQNTLFKSSDRGKNWTELDNGSNLLGSSYVASPKNFDIYFFRGDSYRKYRVLKNDFMEMPYNGMQREGNEPAAINEDGFLYVMSATPENFGIYKSVDDGANWEMIKEFEASANLSALAASGPYIFYSWGIETMYSSDYGATWNEYEGITFGVSDIPTAIAVWKNKAYTFAGNGNLFTAELSPSSVEGYSPASGLIATPTPAGPGADFRISGKEFGPSLKCRAVDYAGRKMEIEYSLSGGEIIISPINCPPGVYYILIDNGAEKYAVKAAIK